MPKTTFRNLPSEKRQIIETEAVHEFAEHGYEAASISQIVSRAGIAKGSFYQYFEDKHDLFMHLVDLAAQEKQAFFRNLPNPDPSLDFFQYLRWLFEAGYAYAARQSTLNQAISRVLFGEGMFMGEAFREVRERSAGMYRELIQRAVKQGDIASTVDPVVAGFVIETLLNALGLFIMNQQTGIQANLQQGSLDWLHSEKARQIVDHLLDILENGMGDPVHR